MHYGPGNNGELNTFLRELELSKLSDLRIIVIGGIPHTDNASWRSDNDLAVIRKVIAKHSNAPVLLIFNPLTFENDNITECGATIKVLPDSGFNVSNVDGKSIQGLALSVLPSLTPAVAPFLRQSHDPLNLTHTIFIHQIQTIYRQYEYTNYFRHHKRAKRKPNTPTRDPRTKKRRRTTATATPPFAKPSSSLSSSTHSDSQTTRTRLSSSNSNIQHITNNANSATGPNGPALRMAPVFRNPNGQQPTYHHRLRATTPSNHNQNGPLVNRRTTQDRRDTFPRGHRLKQNGPQVNVIGTAAQLFEFFQILQVAHQFIHRVYPTGHPYWKSS